MKDINNIAPEHWRIEKVNFPVRWVIQYSFDGKDWNMLHDDFNAYPVYFKDFESAKSHLHKIITLNSSDVLRKWI